MLEPSKSIQFDSWRQLLDWLPKATESQLLTVFVWASDQSQVPAAERAQIDLVRRTAFEDLVRRTRDRLKSYLVNRQGVRDEHLAEDVVQETLLQVYIRAVQFDPHRSFWGWIYRIAYNKLIDHLRRKRPGAIGIGGQSDEEFEGQLHKLAVTNTNPENAALEHERRERLTQQINRLPALQRQIVQRKLDGEKGTDIAQSLGKSSGYVSQIFHEALEVIREQLGE